MTTIPQPTDYVPKTLLKILSKAKVSKEQETIIMTDLIMYITERDHRIKAAAYAAGRASA